MLNACVSPKSPERSIADAVKATLRKYGWSVPASMPNTDWMHTDDIKVLTSVFKRIEAARKGTNLPVEQHQTLLSQLLQRSPKKTGLFGIMCGNSITNILCSKPPFGTL